MLWTKQGAAERWVSDHGWYVIERHPKAPDKYLLLGISSLRRVHSLGLGTFEEVLADAEMVDSTAGQFRADQPNCPWPSWWKG